MLISDINVHKSRLSDVLGYGDEVKGFDAFVADDSLDQLEVYREFLGEKEYNQAKQNYEQALNTMELLYRTEIERLAFSHPPASTTA